MQRVSTSTCIPLYKQSETQHQQIVVAYGTTWHNCDFLLVLVSFREFPLVLVTQSSTIGSCYLRRMLNVKFFVVFLIFGGHPLSFGTSVIHAWKDLAMRIHMPPSPSL